MKRILLLAVAAMMATMSVNAQKGDWAVRARLLGIMSTLTNNDDAEMKMGFGVNVGMDYFLSDKVSIGLDLNTERLGYKSKALDKKTHLDYVGFGPTVRYHVVPWFVLEGGPQLSFLTKSIIGDDSDKENFKNTELTLPLGFAFEPQLNDRGLRLSVGMRYRLGLTRMNKKGDSMHNSAAMVVLGVSGW